MHETDIKKFGKCLSIFSSAAQFIKKWRLHKSAIPSVFLWRKQETWDIKQLDNSLNNDLLLVNDKSFSLYIYVFQLILFYSNFNKKVQYLCRTELNVKKKQKMFSHPFI